MIVLGIDPGTGRLGWSLVKTSSDHKPQLIDCGCIETKAHTPLPERLDNIYQFLIKLIKKHQPDAASIEDLFFARNATTVMSVSAAKGVVLLACQQAGLDIHSYTPLQIKSSLTGYGKADKKQVQYMVKQILKLKEVPQPDDAADAVAAAITHIFHHQTSAKMKS